MARERSPPWPTARSTWSSTSTAISNLDGGRRLLAVPALGGEPLTDLPEPLLLLRRQHVGHGAAEVAPAVERDRLLLGEVEGGEVGMARAQVVLRLDEARAALGLLDLPVREETLGLGLGERAVDDHGIEAPLALQGGGHLAHVGPRRVVLDLDHLARELADPRLDHPRHPA